MFSVRRLRGVEGRVIGRGHVGDTLDIGGPGDIVGVQRPGDREGQIGAARAGSSSRRSSAGWRSADQVPR